MSLHLKYRNVASVPVEVEGIVPDAVCEMSLAEIEKLLVFAGNQQLPLAELFQVSGDPGDQHLIWEGDLAGVHWVGAKMKTGRIHVAGNVGRHLGSEMEGGEICADGDASDWVGGEMHGGLIHVRGRAGHLIGAAYRGSRRGMTGGTILIEGDAGNEIGHTMRRGLLVVGGDAGDLAGFNIIAGTVFVMGNAGIRHGAGMRRGTIGFCGDDPPRMLPSFRHACRFRPQVLPLLFRCLERYGLRVPRAVFDAEFELYHGDLIEGGRGEILLKVA